MSTVSPGIIIYWFAEILLVSFFSEGLIVYYTHLWQRAFAGHSSANTKVHYRIGMLGFILFAGLFFHTAGLYAVDGEMLYHNVCLIIVLFPLFDDHINRFEYFLRCCGIGVFWVIHQLDHISSSIAVASILFLVCILLIIYRFHAQIRHNPVISFMLLTLIGCVFWLSFPHKVTETDFTDVVVSNVVLIRATLMVLVISLFISLYWNYQSRQSKRTHAIEKLAYYDPLTQAKNYTAYTTDIEHRFQNAKLAGTNTVVASIDIDYFKQVNDRFGHLAGNTVLIGVSDLLHNTLKKYGCDQELYRSGGEEFVVIFRNASTNTAAEIITECWSKLSEHDFMYNGHTINITTSVGITNSAPDDTSFQDVYQRADHSLYHSKHNGRQTISIDSMTYLVKMTRNLDALAYFGESVYDLRSPMKPLVADGLILKERNDQTHRWEIINPTSISMKFRISLLKKYLQTSRCQTVTLPLSRIDVSNSDAINSLIAFSQSDLGPERLIIQLTDPHLIDLLPPLTDLDTPIDIWLIQHNVLDLKQAILYTPRIKGLHFILSGHETQDHARHQLFQHWYQFAQDYHLQFAVSHIDQQSSLDLVADLPGINFVQGTKIESTL